MKKVLLGSAVAAALALSGPALAADMPVKAAPLVAPIDWAGFYFGGSLGAAFGRADPSCSPISGLCTTAFNNDTSWVGGLHTTSRIQFSRLVLGWDTNYRFTDLNHAATTPNPLATQRQRTQNIFTTGPELGFAWNNWMLYGTGGYSRTLIEGSAVITATGVFVEGSGLWHNGWFGGVGLEYAFTPGIHFGVLYTHVHANSKVQNVIPPIPVDNHTANAKIDLIEARVNFKLWSGLWGPLSK